jgi:hypothetical protein
MKVLNRQLSLPTVLFLLQNAYPEPSEDDTWLSEFVKLGIMFHMQSPPEPEGSVPSAEQKPLSLNDLVLKYLRELASEGNLVTQSQAATLVTDVGGEETPTEPQDTDLGQLNRAESESPGVNLQHVLAPELESSAASLKDDSLGDDTASEPDHGAERIRIDEEERAKAHAKAAEVAAEEAELAALEAKKARKGKLKIKKDRKRYEELLARAQDRGIERVAEDPEVVVAAEAPLHREWDPVLA